MGGNRSVSGGTGEGLAFSVLDMVTGGTHELLGESEIDDVDSVGVLLDSDSEIVGLDVSVDDSSGVNVLDSLEHLVGGHQHGLQGELSAALVEKVFEGGAEEIHDHDVLVVLNTVVKDLGNGLGEDCGVGVEP